MSRIQEAYLKLCRAEFASALRHLGPTHVETIRIAAKLRAAEDHIHEVNS